MAVKQARGGQEGSTASPSAGRRPFRVKVEARRARKKPRRGGSLLSLDFVDEEPASPMKRALCFVAALACIAGALVGAVLPVIPAIPLWILAAIFMSHAFPAFGRWLSRTRLYRWLLEKLDDPQRASKRPVISRRRKGHLMLAATVATIAILAFALVAPRALGIAMPHGYLWAVSAAVSILWAAAWIWLYAYAREPEATIRTRRSSATSAPYHGPRNGQRKKRS